MNPTETILSFVDSGEIYELDHLGIGHDNQWGQFAVYRADRQVADFAVEASLLRPEHRPPLPGSAELIDLAKAAVSDQDPR